MARPLASLSVALALLAAPTALAEEGPKNTATLLWRDSLPLADGLGMFGIEWERAAGPMTFYFAPSMANPLTEPLTVGLDIGLRFFAFSPAPGGFFVGPQVSAKYIHGPLPGRPPLTITGGVKVGALFGYTLLVNNLFVVSIAVGGEYFRFYEYSPGGEIAQVPGKYGENLGGTLRGALGFAF